MNREDVMRMAMRAGLLDRVDCSNDYFIPADAFIDEMEKLANLAYEAGRKDENEACANVLDDMADDMVREMEPSTAIAYVRSKAAEIRVRVNK